MAFSLTNYRNAEILTLKGEAHIGELFGIDGTPAGYTVYFLEPRTMREIGRQEFSELHAALEYANTLKLKKGCGSGCGSGGCGTGGCGTSGGCGTGGGCGCGKVR